MKNSCHNQVVNEQFGARAAEYVNSQVHAQGADLNAIMDRVGIQPEALALDVGCGGGHVSFHLAPRVKKVVACDLSENMLSEVAAEAEKRSLGNITVLHEAAESLHSPSAMFDIVASRYSVHHWLNPLPGLMQMQRVLKPGGQAFFADVVAPEERLLDTWLQTMELLRDPSHVRNASVSEWQDMLGQAGFDVKETLQYRLRLEFDPWVKRMSTPETQLKAIRALQKCAGKTVTDYFEIEADGSFTVDTMLIVATVKHDE